MDATTTNRIKTTAEWCLSRGISVLPIGEDKKPAIKWGGLNEEPLKEWNFPGCNIAIITGDINGLVVVDCDSEASWVEWARLKPPTPVRVKSRRGMHFWYKWPDGYIKSDSHIKLPGHENEFDVKGGRSYTLLPPSLLNGHQYAFWPSSKNPTAKWVDIDKLPEFDPAWRPDRVKADPWTDSEKVKDARAYLATIRATEGQGGDKQTYKACCKLAASGYPEVEAMALLVDWNQSNCTPPWSTQELLRKLQCAYADVK
jgi:hypothetical protein